MKYWSRRHKDCAQVICEQASALPDYYPPILRVVRTAGHAWVTEVREQAGVVQVFGEAALTLLYQTEDEKGLCSYALTLPFSHSFSLPEGCSGRANAVAGVPNVTCRLTSARRVTFKVSLPVTLTVNGEQELGGPSPAEGMHYLVKPMPMRVLMGEASRKTHISETVECERLPVAALETKGCAVVTELAAAGGKTLVRGELTVHTLYVTREDDVGVACHTFPLSQLLDLPFGEEIDQEVKIGVGAVAVEVGESMNGGRGRLSFDIDLAITAIATTTRTCDLICDAFCATHACTLSRDTTQSSVLAERTRGTAEVMLPLPEDPEGGSVLDVVAVLPALSAKVEGGKLTMEGECALTLLVAEDGGRIRSREVTLPLQITRPCNGTGRAEVCARPWSAIPAGDGVRLVLRYELALWQETSVDYLCSAAPDESKPLPSLERAPVTVYFAEAGEAVWDIAKKYRISPGAIRKANALDGEQLKENCRLLIM